MSLITHPKMLALAREAAPRRSLAGYLAWAAVLLVLAGSWQGAVALLFLRGLFPAQVLEPIRLHVDAKRYLCQADAHLPRIRVTGFAAQPATAGWRV